MRPLGYYGVKPSFLCVCGRRHLCSHLLVDVDTYGLFWGNVDSFGVFYKCQAVFLQTLSSQSFESHVDTVDTYFPLIILSKKPLKGVIQFKTSKISVYSVYIAPKRRTRLIVRRASSSTPPGQAQHIVRHIYVQYASMGGVYLGGGQAPPGRAQAKRMVTGRGGWWVRVVGGQSDTSHKNISQIFPKPLPQHNLQNRANYATIPAIFNGRIRAD